MADGGVDSEDLIRLSLIVIILSWLALVCGRSQRGEALAYYYRYFLEFLWTLSCRACEPGHESLQVGSRGTHCVVSELGVASTRCTPYG